MQLGMIGLGRMGANIVRRVTAGGHECVVYDHDTTAVKALAGEDRTTGVYSVAELAEKLSTPRIVWVMVPAGTITQTVIEELANTLEAGDIVIDGGNSYYRDDLKHSKLLGEKGIHLLDCGTSGGVWGRERGYCLMIGGDEKSFAHAEPLFATIAPGVDAARAHAGPRPATSRNRRRVTCTAAPPGRATSSRWCTTGSSTGSWPRSPRG